MLKKLLLAAALSVASIFAFAQPYYPLTGLGIAGSATVACSTANAILYNAATPCSANLTFSATGSVGAGPLFTVGTSSGTSAGLSFGYLLSGYGSIHPTAVTASALNYALAAGASQTVLNAGAGTLDLAINRSSQVFTVLSIGVAAGSGPTITGGTATSDVAALSITRTNNNAAVVKGISVVYTDTSSAATFKPLEILCGSAGTTNCLTVGKAGNVSTAGQVVAGAFAIASLPTGVSGAIAVVTDQTVACPAKGVAPTAGGAFVCPVFYTGAAWVGL